MLAPATNAVCGTAGSEDSPPVDSFVCRLCLSDPWEHDGETGMAAEQRLGGRSGDERLRLATRSPAKS